MRREYNYVDELVGIGYSIQAPETECQGAPLLVPKTSSKAPYRLAIDIICIQNLGCGTLGGIRDDLLEMDGESGAAPMLVSSSGLVL